MDLLYVAVRGAAGSLPRYKIGGWIQGWGGGVFPLGTLAVNVSGAFLVGFVAVLLLERSTVSDEVRAWVLIGLLGGYTTYSAFTLETLRLTNAGEWGYAILNIVASLSAGFLAVWAGQTLARW